jgi:hypothetical protein
MVIVEVRQDFMAPIEIHDEQLVKRLQWLAEIEEQSVETVIKTLLDQ